MADGHVGHVESVPSTSAWLWAAGGAIISAMGLVLMFSRSYSTVCEKVFTIPYVIDCNSPEIFPPCDQLLKGTVYGQGHWDVFTVLSFAVIMLVWVNGLSYGLQYLLKQRVNGGLIDMEIEQLVHLVIQIIINGISICSIFIAMVEEPFSIGLIWSGFRDYVPFHAKANMLWSISYGLQCVLFNVFVKNELSDWIPCGREITYAVAISIFAYSSKLIQFSYCMLMVNAIFNNLGNFAKVIAVANDDGDTLFGWLFESLQVYGSCCAHVGYLLTTVAVCCYNAQLGFVAKLLLLISVALATIVEVFTAILTWTRDMSAQPIRRKGKVAQKKK